MKPFFIISGLMVGAIIHEARNKPSRLDNMAVGKLKKWISEAEDVLRDPESTEEQQENAMKDINCFSRILKRVGVEVD